MSRRLSPSVVLRRSAASAYNVPMEETQLVIGSGEVGTAIYAVLRDAGAQVHLRDTEPLNLSAGVLHICYPWSPTFTEDTLEYARHHLASLVIVHSTVPPGTCDPYNWVHSPVRGRHPELEDGIRAFTKHVGGYYAEHAAKLLSDVGLRVQVHEHAAETEAGKVWELIQFGLQVMIEQQVHDWCDRYGLNATEVYSDFARTYNDGYATLGEHQFIRPILDHVPGPIGGHCVIQNATMVDHQLSHQLLQHNVSQLETQ